MKTSQPFVMSKTRRKDGRKAWERGISAVYVHSLPSMRARLYEGEQEETLNRRQRKG